MSLTVLTASARGGAHGAVSPDLCAPARGGARVDGTGGGERPDAVDPSLTHPTSPSSHPRYATLTETSESKTLTFRP